MMSATDAGKISGGVFLVGLGLVAWLNFWWPGMLFVIGAAALVRALAEGGRGNALAGGIFMIGLGLIAWLNFWWPGILILVGLSMLLGHNRWHSFWANEHQGSSDPFYEKPKRKNDELI